MPQPSSERAQEAWRSYTSTGQLRQDLLRPEVFRSWERAHRGQLSPRRVEPERLSELESERLLDSHAPLIEASAPYLKALSLAAGAARHATLLGSPSGTLLDRRGDAAFMRALPVPGALMSEDSVGSNGLGTPLAEGTYVELHGAEHFIVGFHEHSCHGIPLVGPLGTVVGALCLSMLIPDSGSHLRGMLFTVAKGIESELRAQALRARLDALQEDPSQAAQAVAMIHQDVVQGQAAARLQLELGAHQLRQGQLGASVLAARQSLARFTRNARTWQLASGVELTEPMSEQELTVNVVELLQTEAKVLQVELLQGEVAETEHAVVTPAFARLVLAEASLVLRAVGPQGRVELLLLPDGTLCFRSCSADGYLTLERRLSYPHVA